jgi:hypothetical protein
MKIGSLLARIADEHPRLGPFLSPIVSMKHAAYQLVRLKIAPLARQRLVPDRVVLKRLFLKKLGYELSLSHPKTFNEKIQWLKLHDRTPRHTVCADKLAVREVIRRELGEEYLIPLYAHTDRLEEITLDSLPDEPCIIKTTHDSGTRFIVRDKRAITEAEWQKFKAQFAKSMARNFYCTTREWQYKNIPRGIIVEKLLLDHGAIPNDYKLHCFNGRVELIQVDLDRATDHKRNLYDINWKRQDFGWKYAGGEDVPRPAHLDEMISSAKKLAAQFCFLRVDFYEVEDAVYFGEMTFHPESGLGPFDPPEWDLKLGQRLRLPVSNRLRFLG